MGSNSSSCVTRATRQDILDVCMSKPRRWSPSQALNHRGCAGTGTNIWNGSRETQLAIVGLLMTVVTSRSKIGMYLAPLAVCSGVNNQSEFASAISPAMAWNVDFDHSIYSNIFEVSMKSHSAKCYIRRSRSSSQRLWSLREND